ncbi:MAG: single-stranded DNA-binding protein [Eubacteriales bacterium]|nr:single-stranded DNA-binding protein [Eubacteriales bacterium]
MLETMIPENTMEYNQVMITGQIVSEFAFHHTAFHEDFYMVKVRVGRMSETVDLIPVMVSERILDVNGSYNGRYVEIHGQFRSYNRKEEQHNHLLLSVFAREIYFVKDRKMIKEKLSMNEIFLDGYICKPPVYRKTPLGREITDIMMAVNRSYGKADYIPCICWGRTARYVAGFEVGARVVIRGRVQSREYIKKDETQHPDKHIAYEVSISKLECRC